MPVLGGGRRERRTSAADRGDGAASQAGVAGEQGMSACASGRDDRPLVMHAAGVSLGWLSDGECSSGLQEKRELVTEGYRMLAPKKPSALLGWRRWPRPELSLIALSIPGPAG